MLAAVERYFAAGRVRLGRVPLEALGQFVVQTTGMLALGQETRPAVDLTGVRHGTGLEGEFAAGWLGTTDYLGGLGDQADATGRLELVTVQVGVQ